ncbi:MAG: AAA family ATPase [Thermoguttaceae bacterium]|nr:AAA family ATPase [Thermoguttaceae bacterium]
MGTRYKVGMYGGAFDPPHLGHLTNMAKAAALCEELYVVICWSEGRESTSKELRYRWILNSLKHLDNVKILFLEDDAATKAEYDADDYWQKGARAIKAAIGKTIDAVFCGSDYRGTGRFESLYAPEADVVYFDRAAIPISSTEIRANPSRYWDYIPAVCRDYYAKKVLIVGSQSVGKTVLTQNLALAYNTTFVAEVGRATCDFAGGEELMIADDLYENLLRQRVNATDAAKTCNRLLFVDTDAITTLFYARYLIKEPEKLASCEKIAAGINEINDWDLVLFLEPDVDFVQDGTRNEDFRAQRIEYSERIKSALREHGVEFNEISGDYAERFEAATRLIEEKLGITTRF